MPNSTECKADRNEIVFFLGKHNLTRTWLLNQLEREGISISKVTLSDILRGVSKSETAKEVLKTSADIITRYGKWVEQ